MVNPKGDKRLQAKLVVYLERFAHLCSRDVFVIKAFHRLNAELKPNHRGFRDACGVLFETFRLEQKVEEEDWLEYAFVDDMYGSCDVVFVHITLRGVFGGCVSFRFVHELE